MDANSLLKITNEQLRQRLIDTLIQRARGYATYSVTEKWTPDGGIITTTQPLVIPPDKAAQDCLDENGIEWRKE